MTPEENAVLYAEYLFKKTYVRLPSRNFKDKKMYCKGLCLLMISELLDNEKRMEHWLKNFVLEGKKFKYKNQGFYFDLVKKEILKLEI